MTDSNEPIGSTHLEPEELEGLKIKNVTSREQLNQLEQENIQAGLYWLNNSRVKYRCTDEFCRKVHQKLFGLVWDWAGKYRQTEKNIGIDPIQISQQMRIELDNVNYWIEHEVYEPREIALRMHHTLVRIHPFPNGNGRHARTMADYLLIKVFKDKRIVWLEGEGSLDEDGAQRDKYLRALREADIGNFSPLLEYMN